MKPERDNREDYPYGYSLKGERCYDLKSGKRTERVSWLAALKNEKLLATLTFEGSCNRNLFEIWLKDCLINKLDPRDIKPLIETEQLQRFTNKCPNKTFAVDLLTVVTYFIYLRNAISL